MLANAGHFDVEIDVRALAAAATEHREVRPLVEQFIVGGRRLNLLAQGRAREPVGGRGPPRGGDGHLLRAAGAVHRAPRARRAGTLERRVHQVPAALEREVARLKLDSLGVGIDELTPDQAQYLSSWDRLRE